MKYTVPQFIDVEDKIMGPLTTRQFLIMLLDAGFIFLAYKLFDFTLFILVAIVLFVAAAILAFLRINGQPFHFFMLNMIQALKRPKLRVWNKELSEDEIRILYKEEPPPPPKAKIRKEVLAETKLTELSLIVNTGGVYNPED